MSRRLAAGLRASLVAAIVLAGCGELPSVGTCPDGMVLVPAGAFRYGEKRTGGQVTREEIAAFCIDRFEFPNRELARPATAVTWLDAAAKCREAGKRLCTEYEWEKACRGHGGQAFSWGASFAAGACGTPRADGPVSGADAACASPYGVRDMSGSVWEWTANAWNGDDATRVARGGWDESVGEDSARCSYRRSLAASHASADVGFRCCAAVTVARLTGLDPGP